MEPPAVAVRTWEPSMSEMAPGAGDPVFLDYTNYKGERNWRKVRPIRLWYGRTEHHPRDQWLLDAWDIDRGAERTFALHGILRWDSSNAWGGQDDPESERLHAAAPDLLAACKVMADAVTADIEILGKQPPKESALGMALAAIAKAEGKTLAEAPPGEGGPG
jgi:hypothetical protein